MFLPGDEVRVKRGDDYQRYPEGRYQDMRLAAEVWHIPGRVSSSHAPDGHHVVIWNYTCHYTEMTIPSQDLEHVSENVTRSGACFRR